MNDIDSRRDVDPVTGAPPPNPRLIVDSKPQSVGSLLRQQYRSETRRAELFLGLAGAVLTLGALLPAVL